MENLYYVFTFHLWKQFYELLSTLSHVNNVWWLILTCVTVLSSRPLFFARVGRPTCGAQSRLQCPILFSSVLSSISLSHLNYTSTSEWYMCITFLSSWVSYTCTLIAPEVRAKFRTTEWFLNKFNSSKPQTFQKMKILKTIRNIHTLNWN